MPTCTTLVPGVSHFFVSTAESAPAPDTIPMLAKPQAAPAIAGWEHLGHLPKEEFFTLDQVRNPDTTEQELFGEFETLCHRPKYWQLRLTLLNFNKLPLAYPGSVVDGPKTHIGDFEGQVRSLYGVFHNGGDPRAIYIPRVRLVSEVGFSLSRDEFVPLELTGYVQPPVEGTTAKFTWLQW